MTAAPTKYPVEALLYITVWLDRGSVTTESYYQCKSLKQAYESFFKAIKQAHADGLIPDSVAAFWAEPEGTSETADKLVDKNDNPVFSDDAQGISFYHDFNDGRHVYFFTSLVAI